MSNYIFFVFFFYNYANEYRELVFIIIIHFHSTLLLLRHERLVKAVNLSLFFFFLLRWAGLIYICRRWRLFARLLFQIHLMRRLREKHPVWNFFYFFIYFISSFGLAFCPPLSQTRRVPVCKCVNHVTFSLDAKDQKDTHHL